MTIRLAMLAAALSFFSGLCGCGIGYNRMLFATKTNVGFEIDSKPPTLQLAINRLEGVFAPQFEGGKKLPVMSSFKFSTKNAFSPSVGSAFATGDAAVVLASLYAAETPVKDWFDRLDLISDAGLNGKKVDSSLALNKEPIIKKSWLSWLATLFEPGGFQEDDVRPVFFGTDTSLGIKVAWSGMSSYIPDTARLGYARKELAWVPITMEKVEASPTKYRVKTSSLLATLDFGMQAPSIDIKQGPSAPLDYVQYFASGNAATLLSLQQTVRQAMLTRLDPNASKLAKEYAAGLAGEAKIQTTLILTQVYDYLVKEASEGVKEANDLVKALDLIGRLPPQSYKFYQWNPTTSPPLLTLTTTSLLDPRSFHDAIEYWDNNRRSIDQVKDLAKKIKEEKKDSPFAFQKKLLPGTGQAENVTSEEKTKLLEEFDGLDKTFTDFDKRLRTHSDVIDAARYFMNMLLPNK
jgi:hypothetical protein